MPAASTPAAASIALSWIDSGRCRKINRTFELPAYAPWISFITGCATAHDGHWKSANSSIVTEAFEGPIAYTGEAPCGALAATVGCVRGVLLAFVARLPFAVFAGGCDVLYNHANPPTVMASTPMIIT